MLDCRLRYRTRFLKHADKGGMNNEQTPKTKPVTLADSRAAHGNPELTILGSAFQIDRAIAQVSSYGSYEKRGDQWVIPGTPEKTRSFVEYPISDLDDIIANADTAVAAVLELHSPGSDWSGNTVCSYCRDECHDGEGLGCGGGTDCSSYPCGTVRTVLDALGLSVRRTEVIPATPERLVDYDPGQPLAFLTNQVARDKLELAARFAGYTSDRTS